MPRGVKNSGPARRGTAVADAASARKGRVVEAAGAAAASKDPNRAKAIEEAMSKAVLQSLADGVTDPAEQRKRMLAARDAARGG